MTEWNGLVTGSFASEIGERSEVSVSATRHLKLNPCQFSASRAGVVRVARGFLYAMRVWLDALHKGLGLNDGAISP
jgi:hypothetical protein